MKKFTGHTEPWGKFIDVKVNAPELIPGRTSKYIGKSIFLSSVTDPYIPIGEKISAHTQDFRKAYSTAAGFRGSDKIRFSFTGYRLTQKIQKL